MTNDKLMRVVDWPFFQTIKQAFLIMLIHPIQTLLMVISIAMSLYLMTFIPGLLFFFGGLFIALLISSINKHQTTLLQNLEVRWFVRFVVRHYP